MKVPKPSQHKDTSKQSLNANIVSTADLLRLIRELKDYEDLMQQRSLVKGTPKSPIPRHSELLEEVADDLSLSLNKHADRKTLLNYLMHVQETAPVIHLTFATEVPAKSLVRLATWFRAEVHDHILFEIGLQPSLVAGCTLRTINKFFDYSLKKTMDETHQSLQSKLGTFVSQP